MTQLQLQAPKTVRTTAPTPILPLRQESIPLVNAGHSHLHRILHLQERLPVRFFQKAQILEAQQFAPSAWAFSNTTSANVHPTPSGMEQKPGAVETTRVVSSIQQALYSASTGNDQEDAQPLDTPTSVPVVESKITELKRVLEHRRAKPLTPYRADEWERLLTEFHLLTKYPSIPCQIRHGFDVGIPPITITYTPPNSQSLYEHAEEYQRIMQREFATNRYVGPLSRSQVEGLIGPFQSSPLSLVPKPGKPGRQRAVHKISHPHSPYHTTSSINHNIDSNLFPCTWGTFSTICFIIWNLPSGSQASIRDVAEAYRTIPVAPEQWPGLVVKLRDDEEFAINTNNNFGLTSAGGVYGSLGDAAADIFRASGIGPISKWVDDHIFFRIPIEHLPSYNDKRREWHTQIMANGGRLQDGSRLWYRGDDMPNGRPAEFDEDASFFLQNLSAASLRSYENVLFSYCDDDIDLLSTTLGIPWELSKTVPFSSRVPYLGFIWDLEARTVTLSDEKKAKYSNAIVEWNARSKHTQEEVERLHGKLLHACLVVPKGRAYLTNLQSMLRNFNKNPFVPHSSPRGTNQDLLWWTTILTEPSLVREIPGPYPVIDRQAYSDASSGVGIGITIGKRWRAWRLLPGWKCQGRDIGWAEAIRFELLVQALLASSSTVEHFKVFGDNRGVVEGWWKGRSRNKLTNEVFRRVHEVASAHRCNIHTRYVPSKDNPADDPSRGIYPPPHYLLPAIPCPPELQQFIVDFDAPPRQSEMDASRRGWHPDPLLKPVRLAVEDLSSLSEDWEESFSGTVGAW
jgi:hypothetical protein